MSDIVAQLQVLARDSGCVVDLSAILDSAVCAEVDIKPSKPHNVEQKGDYVCITPTAPEDSGYEAPEGSYEAPEESYEQPEESYEQPEDSYEQPEESYEQPEDSYEQPEGDYEAPEEEKPYPVPADNGYEAPKETVYPLPSVPSAVPEVEVPYPVTGGDDKPYPPPGSEDNKGDGKDDNSGNNGYQVPDEVCDKPTVALDLEYLVHMGLLTEEELEKYLQTMGELAEDETLGYVDENVKADPLLELNVGEDGDILDLDLLGPDGLLTLNLLDGALRRRGHPAPPVHPPMGGMGGMGGGMGGAGAGGAGGAGNKPKKLLDLDLLSEKDAADNQALIDLDALTGLGKKRRSRRRHLPVVGKPAGGLPVSMPMTSKPNLPVGGHPAGNVPVPMPGAGHPAGGLPTGTVGGVVDGVVGGAGGAGGMGGAGGAAGGAVGGATNKPKKLLDLDLISEKDAADNQALIDLDALTNLGKRQGKLIDADIITCKDKNGALIDVDIITGKCPDAGAGGDDMGGDDSEGGEFLTHYQPICKKGLKKEHLDAAEKTHSQDVNQCLAACNAKAARQTIDMHVAVGDVAHIQVCAGVEFNSSEKGDNCAFLVATEHEPVSEDMLEANEHATTFIRN